MLKSTSLFLVAGTLSVFIACFRGGSPIQAAEVPKVAPAIAEPFDPGSAPKAGTPGLIRRFEVTVTTGTGNESGTEAHIWLSVLVKPGGGQTGGSTTYLGAGALRGSTKTFEADSRRGDLNQERIGGLVLVNGLNGQSPDWEVQRVRIIGVDQQGVRWLVADYSVPASEAWRRWLKNDPSYPFQGPSMSIPTLSEWQRQ